MRSRAAFMVLLSFLIMFFISSQARSAEPSKYVEIMLDASGSMWGQMGGEAKIAIAKKVLTETVEGMKGRGDLAISVRVYGHQFDKSKKNCQDTRLELPFAVPDPVKVRDLISRIKAQGQTPIAYSLGEAGKDFAGRQSAQKVIILITDGLESCDGDPCAAAKALAAAGVGVKMHVVGFDLKPGELEKLKCLVDPSGGLLIAAKDAAQLKGALDQVVKKAIKDNLVVQVLGVDNKPIASYMEVFAAGTDKKVDSGSTAEAGSGSREKAGFKLPAGTYDISVQSHVTSERQTVKGIVVKEDEATEKVISFASGVITGLAKDLAGAPVPGYLVVARNDGVEDKFVNAGQSGANPAAFSVVPGTYKLKIQQDRTKETKVFDGIVIAAGQTVAKDAAFGEGSVSFVAKDTTGAPVATTLESWKTPGDEWVRAGQSGSSPFIFYLAPGTYRFMVSNDKTKEKKAFEGVAVADKQAIVKEVPFGHARLSVMAKDASGAPVPASIEVALVEPAGTRTLFYEDSGAEPRVFTVPAGTLKISIKNKNTGAYKTLENIVITDGQQLLKEVVF
ncbi:MAG: VWA domain-containing protein [bacterium]